MRIIKILSEMIEDTIKCADEYIEFAVEWKEDHPDVAKTLAMLSENEMSNMNSLHSTVTKIISEYRKTNGEPPASMLAVYDYLHKRHIEDAARVKAMQQMYKDS